MKRQCSEKPLAPPKNADGNAINPINDIKDKACCGESIKPGITTQAITTQIAQMPTFLKAEYQRCAFTSCRL